MPEGGIGVGVGNHPSFFTIDEVNTIDEVKVLERMRPADVDVGAEGRKVWSPLAIFAAEQDDIFPEMKRRETEDVLKGTGATWSCTTFSQTEHAFRYVVGGLVDGYPSLVSENVLTLASFQAFEMISMTRPFDLRANLLYRAQLPGLLSISVCLDERARNSLFRISCKGAVP